MFALWFVGYRLVYVATQRVDGCAQPEILCAFCTREQTGRDN